MSPGLIIHYADEVLSLTAHDLERVKEAIGILKDDLEAFQLLLVNGRTAESLHQAGNGEARADIAKIIDDLIDLVGAGMLEVQAPELDINRYEVLCSEFEKYTKKVGDACREPAARRIGRIDGEVAVHVVIRSIGQRCRDMQSLVLVELTPVADLRLQKLAVIAVDHVMCPLQLEAQGARL